MPKPPGFVAPPSVDQLVTDDGEPLESNRHRLQMNLLIEPLVRHWDDRQDFFVGGNMFLYYSALQVKKNDFRGPDVLVVQGTQRRDRKAWVVWEEGGKLPSVIIEITSETTQREDRGPKKRLYEAVLRIPEYFIYDPDSGELEGYVLDAMSDRYVPAPAAGEGGFVSRRTGLELRVWSGLHAGIDASWLRWHTPDGEPLPTDAERAEREAARAEREAARADALEAELAGLRRSSSARGEPPAD